MADAGAIISERHGLNGSSPMRAVINSNILAHQQRGSRLQTLLLCRNRTDEL